MKSLDIARVSSFARRGWALLILLMSGLVLFPIPLRANPEPPRRADRAPLNDPDPTPPYWDGGSGSAVHFPPVAWPTDPVWTGYTKEGSEIKDQRTQDPSNGGTSPQNYVNISSNCTDQALPSVFWTYDAGNQVLFFRWRVEQIANTYGTGPSAGAFSTSDPWKSAQWTVLIDIDGDGYREFAVHLDGSSGSPSQPVDRLVSIYSNTPSHSIDYLNDPNVYALYHNPTAFVDQATGRILNFQSTLNPTPNWPNGSHETVWDYGATRSINISNSTCTEYIVDYQIPLAMLDATSVGGPKITSNTPISMLFTTANSLQNPLQKDVVLDGDFIGDENKPGPFGDPVIPPTGTIQQPIVESVSASGCGPTTLIAQVRDTLNAQGQTNVTAVDFIYYYDRNGNSIADDGSAWTFAASGSTTNNPVGQWTATWNNAALVQGRYLIGVQATDNAAINADGKTHRTYSYLTAAQVTALGSPPGNELWYANPSPAPGAITGAATNSCGTPPPALSKSASPNLVTAGQLVTFTLSVNNTEPAALTVSTITDTLPMGFTYVATSGASTLGSPVPTINGNFVTWNFSPVATVPAGSTRTLIFTATAATTVGTYSNTAIANTSIGLLRSNPAQVGVGLPRLTIAKAASVSSANPGNTLTYTITYANDSPVNVTGVTITDALPTGLTFVSAANGGSYNAGTRTITWSIGPIASGDGPYTVSFTATVDNPYPLAAAVPLVNSATITSNETSPASASASINVNAPRPKLGIQKDANVTQVAPGNQATFTISYANAGNASATSVTITDAVPSGFTFVSATNGGTLSSGIVTWSVGSVAAGASGSVQLTLQATNPYTRSNPAVNTAFLSSAQTAPVSDDFTIGITESGLVCRTYYFHNTTTNVGFDGLRRIADPTAPLPSQTGAGVLFTTIDGGGFSEVLRFYQDPPSNSTVNFASDINSTIYIDRHPGSGIYLRGTVYDYDSATGIRTTIGTGTQDFGGNDTGSFNFSATPVVGATLQPGHRLLWIYELASKNNQGGDRLLFQFDGTVVDSESGSGSTFADSNSVFCVTAPANVVLDKQVSSLTVQAGSPLTYSLKFANAGTTNATNSLITDTLPTGTTFVSAALNGSPATPVAINGQQYRFAVNSTGQAAGVIAGGGSGILTITVSVNQPLDPAINTLTNLATLTTNETVPLSDSIATTILRPNTTIGKAASKTLLIPGDVVTYTLTVLNSGIITATNVMVNDTLPVVGYFTYVSNSTTLNGTTVSPDPVTGNTLNLNTGSLAPGATATVTFRMFVGPGVPFPGVTTHDNVATVSDAQTTGTRSSEVVTVSISTNPNLHVSKSIAPSSMLAPGDLVTYTISLSNIGSGNANNLVVEDFVPANMIYAPGTLYDQSVSQTDASDGDTGSFDSSNNRVLFEISALAGGATRTLQFSTRVNSPLPAGITPISNTVTASASNAATKQGSASTQASAAPVLTLSKTGPSVVAFPAARLTASASGGTTIQVDTSAQLRVQQYVNITGQASRIIGINGNSITLDSAVTAALGENVIGSLTYSLRYANTGTAIATSVVMTDTLPAGTSFVNATLGGVPSGGNVIWNLPDLAPGDLGLAQLTIFPTAIGSIVNTATLDSAQTAPVSANATTSVGALVDSKFTTTPLVLQTLTGAEATYVLQVQNTFPSPASGVVVTDTLSSGFTFSKTVAMSGYSSNSPAINPTFGTEQPVWATFTIPGNTTLAITYTAKINPTVGAATYQNFFGSTSSSASVLVFDPLRTIAEDVQVEIPDVTLSKSVSPSTVPVGQPVTYTIAALNNGDGAATGVVLTDTLPSGFTLVSTISATTNNATRTSTQNPSAGSATPAWGIWDIGPGGGVTVTFTAHTGAVTGVFSNTVSATASNTTINPVTNTAVVTTTPSADLQVTKSVTPDPVSVGMPLTYTLVTRNNGPTTATTVTLTDTLPTTVTLASVSSTQGTCSGTSTILCNLGSLANGAMVTTTIVVTPTQSGSLTNTATVGASEFDPNLSDNADTEITTANALADLAITKSASPSPVHAASTLTYTLAITNSGPSFASNVSVTDTLPAGATFGSIIASTWTCNQASGVVTCTRATLPAFATDAITITVTAPSAGGTLANSVGITSTTSDPNPADNTFSVNTPVTPVADLSISKTDGQLTATPGQMITYTVVVSNTGPSAATGAPVTDTLPAVLINATWTCVASLGSSCATPNGSGNIATTVNLAANGFVTFTISATINSSAGGSLVNTATVAAPAGVTDSNLDNNSATDTDTLAGSADLAITKSHNGNFTIGQNGAYTLTVTNNGPSTAAATLTVTDTLPSGLTFVSGTGSGWNCSPSGQNVTCTSPSDLGFGVSTSIVLTVSVGASTPPNITNSAGVSSPTSDPQTNNNTTTDPTTVVKVADLGIAKSDGQINATPGSSLTYTITITNAGPSPAIGAIVSDTLPVILTAANWTCSGAGGASCAAATGSGNISTTVDVPVGSTATFVLTATVSASATGTLANTATVAPPSDVTDSALDNNASTDTDTLTPLADLAIGKTAAPNPVNAGATLTYTLNVTNTGPSDAANVVVTDTLPAGVTYGSAGGAGWTCGHSSGVVTCTRAAFGVSATSAITVAVTAPSAGGTITNNATIASSTTDPNLANNDASAATTVSAVANLSISKNDGRSSVTPGTQTTYTIVVTNAGPSPVNGAVVSDALPAVLNSASWTCSASLGSSCASASGSGGINTTVNLLNAGTATFMMTATVSASATGSVTNIAAVTAPAGVTDPDGSNNTASDTDSLTPSADLAIGKTHAGNFTVGANGTYVLTITNLGPSTAQGPILVTDTLPSGLTFVSGTGTGWTCLPNGQIVSCSNPSSIGPSASSTITLVVGVAQGAFPGITNAVEVAGPTPDPNSSNNSTTDPTTVNNLPDLRLGKTHTGTSSPGGALTYTLTFTNSGTLAANGVVITETVPQNTRYTGSGWTCPSGTGAGSICTLAIGSVAGSDAGSVQFTVTISNPVPAGTTQIVNTAMVADDGAQGPDPTPSNNIATDTTTLTGRAPDLGIEITHNPSSSIPGGTVTFTLAYSNTGNIGATNVTITETVPANTTYTGTGWSCPTGSVAGTVCTRNVGTVESGSSGSVPFVVTVVSPVPAGTTQIGDNASIGDDGANGVDTNLANNSDSDAVPLITQVDLRMTKSDGGVSVSPGGSITYTLTYTNAGNIAATGVVITETTPANTTYAGSGWSCGAVTCTRGIGSVLGGGTGSVAFTVQVANPVPPGTTQISNSAIIGDDHASGVDANPGDNIATDTTPVLQGADLEIVKTDLQATAIPGASLTYTITVTNHGPIPVVGAGVSDALPAALTNATWTCSASSGSSCGSASGTGSINSTVNLSVNGVATYLLTATVSSNATGSVVNTASVSPPSGVNDPIPENNSATDTDSLTPSADLAISKSHTGNFTVGVNGSYTITVTNNGPSAVAAPVLVTDTLPNGLTAVSNSAGWLCTPIGQQVSCESAAGLGVGASTILLLNVAVTQAAAPGITNLAQVSNAASDPNPINNTASDPTIVNQAPDLRLSKTHVGTATPNGILVYTLGYTNTGDLTATGVVITETVPANTRYTGAGWTCPSGTGAGSVCTRAIANLAGDGGFGSVSFSVTISNPLPVGTTQIANTATIADDGTHGPDATPSNNSATDTAPLTGAAPDLRVSKSDNGVTPTPGGVLSYLINYANVGNIGATNVVLTETLPANTTFIGTGWTCVGSSCTRTVGSLAGGGASGSAEFVVLLDNPLPPAVTQITNTISIGDDGTNGADANPADNSATINTPVLALGAICVTAYRDVNGSGMREVGEGLLSGAVITVTDASNIVVGTWTTNGSEPHCFANLPVGNYTVVERNPVGYTSTTSDLVSAAVQTGFTTLVDFGDQQFTPTPTATATRTPTVGNSNVYLPIVVKSVPDNTPTPSITPTPSRTPTATATRVMVDPKGMLSDPDHDQLFLVSNGDSTVDVFRESTLATSPELLRKIGVGRSPFGIGMANGKVYVANFSGNSVSVIRTSDLVRLPDISLAACGGEPTHLATNPGTGMVYVALHSGAKVAVIDAFTDTRVGCVPVASGTFGGTFGLAVDTGTNSIFAGNRDGFDLWRIDGATNNATQVRSYANGNGGSPFYVGFNEVTRKLFVTVGFFEGAGANREIVPNKLYIYDVEWTGELSNETIVSVGNTDDGGFVVQSMCSAYIYVAETADNRLRALDPFDNYATVWTTTPGPYIDAHPYGLLESMGATFTRIYVSHKNPAHTLRIIDECPGPFNAFRLPRIIATPTRPSTQTVTPTRTTTAAPTTTRTLTVAPTATRTATATIVPTRTPMATPPSAPTGTPTAAHTRTPTPSSTPTSASPPTGTATPTATPSKTPTPSATATK